MAEDRLFSGFMNHDYVLTFSIADATHRQQLIALCEGPWMGDEITDNTWEISNDLSPDEMEQTVTDLLQKGDKMAYYYLTPSLSSGMPGVPDAKRIFRVVLG